MAKSNPLDPYALCVGRICHAWADVEKAIVGLFALLVGANAPDKWVMLDCLDQRDATRGVKLGAVASARSDPERDWADIVADDLDYIDNKLRPLRNQYVHDNWISDERGVTHATNRPRIIQRQSRARREVEFVQLHQGDLKEMRALLSDLRAFEDWLWDLYVWKEQVQFVEHPEAKLSALLRARPRRRIPLPR
jgi:hypothetical protein